MRTDGVRNASLQLGWKWRSGIDTGIHVLLDLYLAVDVCGIGVVGRCDVVAVEKVGFREGSLLGRQQREIRLR
jgi:hypothetical protein